MRLAQDGMMGLWQVKMSARQSACVANFWRFMPFIMPAAAHTCRVSPPPALPTPCSLLVLLIVALFYAGAAIIYKLALSPSKSQKLLEAQRRRRTRRD